MKLYFLINRNQLVSKNHNCILTKRIAELGFLSSEPPRTVVNQALTLFCEEDLQLLCALCTQPPDHQGHQVREKAENRREKLASEFEQLIESVECEREAVISRITAEEKHIQRNLSANKAAFSDYISKLKVLLKELAEKSVMSDVKMMMNIKDVFDRCEKLQPPTVYSFQYKREEFSLPPQCSALQKIIQRFREEITLDPETAHPNLLVSEDRKSVTFVKKKQRVQWNPKRFMVDPVVLGTKGFDCGRHYWEVQVDDKPEWAVGVCKDSLSEEKKQPLLRQKNRCWMIQLLDGDYVAGGSAPVTLVLKKMPRGIGVYLDYELGQVSFYSLNDMSHIYSFRDTFSEMLKPYFYIGCDPKPLIVRAFRD
ncbi:putative tripartite motif-containing protein 75 [Pipistrellus kuhlii]|uniref:putative tripartite motif-containing protein 75 n=1 Tax=Pipistrellus kuhlii TaxID=59472 RepID=UPI00174EFE27|nr:putative tripartite motif-containing protein 75 [Pipistrellus kuhlii]